MLRRRGDFARENEPPVNGAARAAHYFLIGARCGALNADRRALGYAAFDIPFQESSMTIRANLFYAALLAGAATFAAMPAQALTAQECSAKYQAAKSAGTLGDQKWNDFRKAQCGADATPAAATTAAPKETPKETPKAAATPKEAPKAAAAPKEPPKTAAAPAAAGAAVFPTAVSPKYSSETAGKARMHTCVDQYNANKATNANGGLKWIQKGGGYYSECTKRLKG